MMRVVKVLGGAILAALAAFALFYGWLQTDGGRSWLAAEAGRLLSRNGERVSVSGLAGPVPFDFSLRSVVVADELGPRLTVEDARVTISARDLFAGRLVIRTITARRVEFARESASQGGGDDWRALLHPLLPLRIESATLDTLFIGAPVLGTPMTLEAHASGAIGGGKAEADLSLHRIDGTPGEASLHFAFDGGMLALDGKVREPTGTVLASLLGRTDKLPLTLTIAGSGPLDRWRGDLAFAAGADATASGTVTISGDEPRRIELTASARIAPLLPPEYRMLAAGGVRLDGAVALGKRDISVERFELASAAARLSAEGTYARDGKRLSGTAHVALPDLAPLAPLIGAPIAGRGSAAIDIGGTAARPSLDASADFADLAGDAGCAAAAHATISLLAAGDPRTAPTAIAAAGWLAGVTPAPEGMGSTATWRISARFDPHSGTIAADTIALVDGGATLDGIASASRDGASGVLRVRLPELAALDGGALAGALDASADFRAAADGTGIAVISGSIAQPRTGTPLLDAALGAHVDLSGTISREANGTIAARDVALDGLNARLSGDGERLASGRLALRFSAAAPRLAALDPSLSGPVSASGTLEGPPNALAGAVTIDTPEIAASGIDIARLSAQLTLARVWPLSARIEAKAAVHGIETTLSADAAAAPDEFHVGRFEVGAAGASAGGTLSWVKGRLDAGIKATIPELRPFAVAAGVPLDGHATLDARITGQRVEATIDASGLTAAGASARHVRFTADIANLFARPTGSAEIALGDATAGGASIAAAKIGATSSSPGRFALTGAAQGKLGGKFTLATGGTLTIANGAGSLALAQFKGAIGTAAFALAEPLHADWRGGGFRFSDLKLTFGSGTLLGDGAVERGAVRFHLLARALPVYVLASLANYEAQGQLGFELTIGGTRRAPEAHLVVDGEGLRLAGETRIDMPDLGLVFDAAWQGGVVQFKGRLAGPGGAALGWQGSAPFVLDPDRLAFSIPRQGALAFHLEGSGELAMLSDLLPLGQDRIAGRFATNVSVAGTVAEPEASGRLTVTEGRYESLFTGGTLAGINLTLVGDRDRLVLQDFTANDGAQGSVHASGAIDLAGPAGPSFDASAVFSHFRALRRDEASATVSGTAHVTGGLAAPKMTTALIIEEAAIAVPKELPQSSQPVAAIVINSATGATLSGPQTATARGLVPIALDVTITAPGKVFVRGRGLDSEWRGRVTINGSTQAPRIAGKLEVVRGTFDFIGKTFNLSKGVVSFTGGRSIDPTIDIVAQAQSTDITAIAAIAGTATQPTIKLSSEPALPRDEILSRLLFGASMSQISPAEGLELASAAASLAGGQSLDVLSRIRTGLGLDRLGLGSAPATVVPGLGVPAMTGPPGTNSNSTPAGVGTTPLAPGATSGSQAANTALNAGKYVTNGVFVGVSQGLYSASSTVTVTVDLTRHITVDTEAGQASGSGVGINWKLDY